MTAHDQNCGSGLPDCRAVLYIAGDAPNSRIALKNMKMIQENISQWNLQVAIVDVVASPEVALEKGIYLTPALEIAAHGMESLVYGNLSDKEKILALFGEKHDDVQGAAVL